jgi:hypothetical protein
VFHDEIHFELPGFPHEQIERAPQLDAGHRLGQEILDLPWYATIFLPAGPSTVARAPSSPVGISAAARFLRSLGLR